MKIQNHIEQVRRSIENLTEYATSGDIQAHEALAEIKQSFLDDFLKLEIKKIQDESLQVLRDNFIEHGKKSYADSNYRYTIRAGSTRYSFTAVEEVKKKKKDLELSEQYKQLKATESKYKTAFILKQKGQSIVDEDTGEIIDVSGVNVVYSSDSITVKRL
ncbi:hypothetical protein [Aquimarina algiphila]|uniref:Uncharacterized protein n=1 Tax=Aquimarina algiphila TaxID=2047982 RepID=A0A554VAS9_9FLAO|nr:hypothetical protein [Aquimarina algiphila]TSE03353.1 hypothetical protein FOF46_29570 [Aquimarina algiphila]